MPIGRIASRSRLLLAAAAWLLGALPGCATVRQNADSADLRPCSDGYAVTDDGWKLGIRHIRPEHPDPNKLPVVLCHGMGLNATFWTICDDHLPGQFAARGYDVFLVDMRGSGFSHHVGVLGSLDTRLKQTFVREIGGGRWTMDDQAFHDVPAILNFVCAQTGKSQVNWVGHSLGGMLMFPALERDPAVEARVANLVAMGSPATLERFPRHALLGANRALRSMLRVVSTGRIARPMKYYRLPGLEVIDRYYFTASNVAPRTVSRFYGYTLEDPGRGALRQMDMYLATGHLWSEDGRVDYSDELGRITTPTLMVAGEKDVIADIASTEITFKALGSPDKELMRFGRDTGQHFDYGHCDLVWSVYAPTEVFPTMIDWLDRRQPPGPAVAAPPAASGPAPPPLQSIDAELRPGLEPITEAG